MKRTFIKKSLFAILATVFSLASSFGQATITTGVLSPTTVCEGGNVSVPYTTTGVTAPLTNFVAQLSDAAGAFGAPVEIGSSATTPITATIPAGTAAGAAYKIRVISVLAAITIATGSESAALKVNAIPAAPTVASPVPYAQGAAAVALSATGTGLLWYDDAADDTGNPAAPVPATTTAGTTSYYVSQTVGGCEGPRAKIDVTVTACTPPAKPTVANKTYEVGENAPVLTATGTNLKWYADASTTTALPGAPKPSTGAAGVTKYYVTQTNASDCESVRAEITVTVTACTPPAKPGVANKTYEVGDNAPVLTATGTNLKWYADASTTTALPGAPKPSTGAAGVTKYYVTQTNASDCESERAEITVTVTACTPPAKPGVANKTYEVGENAPVLTATGTNLKWYADASTTTALPGAPKPSTGAAGVTKYYVTQTNASDCESERAEITVTVTACTPPAKPGVANKTYEVGDNAPVLTATGTNLKWYADASTTTALPGAPKPSTASAGVTKYYVTQTNASDCESERAEITVTVTACTPPAKPGVANKTYEVGDNAPVLTATGTNLKWYADASIATALPGAPKPSTTSVGVTKYYVTQTNASNCESERAEITVTVTACTPPAAPGVSNVSYCINGTTVVLTATGTGLKWYVASSGGTALGAAPKPSSATEGTTSYFVSQTVGGCESARAEIKVTINKTDPPAVTNLDYCLNATASTLTATGTGLKWYAAANGGAGSASAPTPTTNAVGTKSYFVTQTLNGCESTRAEIKVTIKNLSALPTVTAVLNICQNSTATALTATGANLKWYTVSTGGTALGAAPVPATATSGTTSYFVSQTAAGLCEGPRAKIDVVVKDTPLAPAVTPVNYCVSAKAVALTPAGGVYKWYTVPTGGTGSATGPVPATTTPGTTSYYLTQSNTYGTLSCESPRAKQDVIVNATPAPLTTVSDIFCQERADKTYTFPTKAAEGNSIKWYTVATGGTATSTTPSVNLKTSGETIFYATQFSAKGCESTARVVQKVRVKPLPALPAIEKPVIEYCQFVPAVPLTATPVTNGILNWYNTNNQGEAPIGAAPTPSTAEGGTTSYFVGQTLEGCISDRAKIDVKINTTPKPTTTTALAYCQNEVAPVLSATGTILKWYREANGTEWQGVPFTPFTEKVQDYSFYVTQTGTVNGCESPKEEIRVHIKSLPSATISGATTIDLGQTATVTIKFTGDGPWIYALSNGITDTTDQANHQVQVKPSTTTSYLVTEVSNACGKGLPIGTALVTVKIPTNTSGNPSVAEACAGKTFNVPFQQSGDFPAGNSFKLQIATVNEDAKFWTIPSVATSNSVTATFPDTTKGGTYFLRVISAGTNPDFTVKGSVSAITITASPLPIATLTGTQTILVGESADLKVDITGKSPWTFTLNNGVKDTLITAAVTPFTFKMSPRVTTTYTITKSTNGCGTGTGAGSARVQVDPILGVEPPAPADWVKIYPTLIDSKVTVEITGVVSPKEASVEVIDLNGRSRAVKAIRQKTTDVDFGGYPSGLYLIRIQNGNLNTVQRVMKP